MTRLSSFLILTLLLSGLAACTSATVSPGSAPQAAVAPPPVQVAAASLPGEYGLASYHREEDKDRTLSQAKIACRNPYKIDPGSSGGVVMHAPGQPGPAEFFVKKDANGASFLGPRGPAGAPQDQRILSYDNGTLVTQWVSGRLRTVYGTMVYVPCAQS